MAKSEYEKMFLAETNYFWFVAKQKLVFEILRQINLPKAPALLDLGAGTGITLNQLEKSGFAVGLDPFPEALEFCRKRELKNLVLGSGQELPFKDNGFDLITSLDTIEHTDNPFKMLSEVFRVLSAGGYFILSAPAYPWLLSRHDLALGHKKRYTKKALQSLLYQVGFRIEKLGHFYGLVFPLAFTLKIYQKWWGSKTQTISYYLPFPLNQILVGLCALEAKLFNRWSFPFGTSLIAICKK